jgi:hypothetical protein
MPDTDALTTQQLFKRWRSGDAKAGHAMAQRFSDWYYAISASRLGDRDGRAPLERACKRFGEGIVTVSDANSLTTWAHGVLTEELTSAGKRLNGGDQPNALTNRRSPTELLKKAQVALPREQVNLLTKAYDASYPLDKLEEEAEAMGGYPLAVLQARYALKQWLKDDEGVKFSEVPDSPNMDRAPLPLYEAGRMPNEAQEHAFEKWMLSDLTLCKDVAEFAAFALAMRGGVLEIRTESSPVPSPAAEKSVHPSGRVAIAAAEEREESDSKMGTIVGLVVVVAIAAAAFMFLK